MCIYLYGLFILSQSRFGFDSRYWSNKESFNLQGGTTGFDKNETKLPSYWSTPFSKICLGMKVGDGTPRFILMNKTAGSLYSLIADGKYRPTKLGRQTWKKLIEASSLQQHCNREGFNTERDLLPRRQELVSMPTKKIIVNPVIPESHLEELVILMIPTHVETWLLIMERTGKGESRQWDVSWCSN